MLVCDRSLGGNQSYNKHRIVPPFYTMKKLFVICLSILVITTMSSCIYRSNVYVGMDDNDPSQCVHTITHHHFLFGIINCDNDEDMYRYLGNQEAYRIKNYITPLDFFLTAVTGGIYSPSTTEIYLPK